MRIIVLGVVLASSCTTRELDAGPIDLGTINGCPSLGALHLRAEQVINDTPGLAPDSLWDDLITGDDIEKEGGFVATMSYRFFASKTFLDPIVVPHAVPLDSKSEGLTMTVSHASGDTDSYVLQDGTATVTAIDDTQPKGKISVEGTSVSFEPVDRDGLRVQGAPCVGIASFHLSGSYDNE